MHESLMYIHVHIVGRSIARISRRAFYKDRALARGEIFKATPTNKPNHVFYACARTVLFQIYVIVILQ